MCTYIYAIEKDRDMCVCVYIYRCAHTYTDAHACAYNLLASSNFSEQKSSCTACQCLNQWLFGADFCLTVAL